MKKILFLLFTLSVVSFTQTQSEYTVIDTKGAALGLEAPEWINYVSSVSQMQSLFPGKVAFVKYETGPNLSLIQRRVNTTGINADYARVVSTAVKQAFKEHANWSDEEFNQKMGEDSIIGSAKAKFKGLKKEGDWWVLRRDLDGNKEYTYYVLYLLDEQIFLKDLGLIIEESAQSIGNSALGDKVKSDIQNVEELFYENQTPY
ncbi:hypothetical protein Q5M87_11945 [Brachyspira innocens]|uniref:Uncharacterized protein n=1 Tax=Brachyspira innocens TaxID=13264 RepID=A0ABT8YZ25_9SPIR|nr:hypothetical protein [Brachyspira innocens]MDO6994719.1 hypothetical protein [Brachyspira innocens]MDO7020815.1 hypothetical protein [Brachyspira innocens]